MKNRVGLAALGFQTKERTGVGHHTVSLLRNLNPDGTNLEYHYLGDLDPSDLPATVDHHQVRDNGFLSTLYQNHYGLGALADRLDLDLLHTPKSRIPLGFSGRKTATIHDVIFFTHPEYYNLPERLYWQYATRMAVRQADGIVTVSQSSARAIADHCKIEAADLRVIPNGINANRFTPEAHDEDAYWMNYYEVPEPFHLYLGGFYPRKNLKRLLQAYEQANQRWSDSLPHLVLAGPTAHSSSKLDELLAAHRNRRDVHITGYVRDEALPSLMRRASRLYYPTLAEGFGLPVLQALCCLTPVFCSDLSVLREVAGDNATYFNPESIESIAETLDPELEPYVDPDVRNRLVQKYDWSAVAESHSEFFQEILSR